MVYNRITGFLDFVHRPEFQITRKTTFRQLDRFLSQGEGRETLLGLLERANLNLRRLDLFLSSGEGRDTSNMLGPLERANLYQTY
jgi:hypothetical protein